MHMCWTHRWHFSKKCAGVLRHNEWAPFDSKHWIPLRYMIDVFNGDAAYDYTILPIHVTQAVFLNNKGRFELACVVTGVVFNPLESDVAPPGKNMEWFIRARQGHSVEAIGETLPDYDVVTKDNVHKFPALPTTSSHLPS